MIVTVSDILENDKDVRGSTAVIYLGDVPSQEGSNKFSATDEPFITVELDSTEPHDTKSGVSTLDVGEVTVRSFHSERRDALALSKLVRTALDRYSGTIEGETVQSIRFNSEATDYQVIDNKLFQFVEQDYSVRLKR